MHANDSPTIKSGVVIGIIENEEGQSLKPDQSASVTFESMANTTVTPGGLKEKQGGSREKRGKQERGRRTRWLPVMKSGGSVAAGNRSRKR